ncbi:hypothetical protein P364_0114305 [Paenibacillus sp. MAEPY2]|nr:hypothetical protein P363_0128050 [Paenibacillus sp. MAEPY1]KGP81986.1 hypothetical protein P364_0114305 [Paenibacillus sp. MAEPY2]
MMVNIILLQCMISLPPCRKLGLIKWLREGKIASFSWLCNIQYLRSIFILRQFLAEIVFARIPHTLPPHHFSVKTLSYELRKKG